MSLKLDDLIGKKKEVVQVLDLSKATANNPEEFKRVMEKVPDFKIKPEKIKAEDIKIQDRPKRWNWRPKKIPYQFADPLPVEMRSLRLEDLCSVPIQWNMLTTLRPKSKLDEEYFSRLVELGKLELATAEKEKKIPVTSFMRKMKSRSGVGETRFISCPECGEDFCQKELCTLFQYENFKRVPIAETINKKEDETHNRTKKKKRVKSKPRKSRSRVRSKSRDKSKSRTRSKSRPRSKSKTRPKSKNRSKSRGRSKTRGRSKSGSKERESEGAKEKPKQGVKSGAVPKTRKPSKSAARKTKGKSQNGSSTK